MTTPPSAQPSPWWQRLRRHRERPAAIAHPTEADVALDPALAGSRAVGGTHDELAGDRGSTTGTGRTGIFVGRISGDDVGYAGETGAERRRPTSTIIRTPGIVPTNESPTRPPRGRPCGHGTASRNPTPPVTRAMAPTRRDDGPALGEPE